MTAVNEIIPLKGKWLGDWKKNDKNGSTINYKAGDWVAVGANHWYCVTGHSATSQFQPVIEENGKFIVYWELYNHITVSTQADSAGINVLPVTGRVAQGDRF